MTGTPEQSAEEENGKRADPKLLELLVCPITRTRLEYDRERQELISSAAGLAFPIKNGVPLMTADAARPLDVVKDNR